MRLILIIAITFFIYSHSVALHCDKYLLEIEQTNLMTGEAIKYTIKDDKIKIYKRINENKCRLVTTNNITTDKVDSINRIILQIMDSCNLHDTIFSNSTILDGFSWFVTISVGNKSKIFKVYNCYHSQLDNIIQLINEEIKKSKRLIFPTGKMYMNSKCD